MKMTLKSRLDKAIIFVNVIVLYLLLLSICNVPSLVLSKPFKSVDNGLHRDETTLPINVRNNGGEVFREVIRSNAKENWIRIEFRETDGSLVKQIIDFRNKLQLFSLTRLGEQDLGERRVQTFCFLTSLPEHEYVSAESMSQLTQGNPAAIRQAEFDSGTIQLGMDVEIVPADNKHGHASFALFSEHIDVHCGTAANSDARVYGTENDLRKWAQQNAKQNFANFTEALRPLDSWTRNSDPVSVGSSSSSRQSGAPSSPERIVSSSGPSSSGSAKIVPNNSEPNGANVFDSNLSNPVAPPFSSVTSRRCGDILHSIYRNLTSQASAETSIDFRLGSQFTGTSNSTNVGQKRKPGAGTNEKLCQCSMSLVIPFYACDIKYCTKEDAKDSQKNRYRCGIKTCRRRYDFLFTVSDKLSCLSSFDPTVPNDQHSESNSLTHLDDENEIIHHSDLNSEQKSDILQNN